MHQRQRPVWERQRKLQKNPQFSPAKIPVFIPVAIMASMLKRSTVGDMHTNAGKKYKFL